MFLFFIRHFNDVDHITPIVWKMKRDNYTVAVYCLNPEYDIDSDYRLQSLRQIGVKVNYIYDEFSQNLGIKHWILRLISRLCFKIARTRDNQPPSGIYRLFPKFRKLALKRGRRYYKQSRDKFYDRVWARYVIEKSATKVLCFDWVRPNRYVVKAILSAAKEMAVPTVSLPHGVFIYTNDSVMIESDDNERNYSKFNLYDYVTVQNDLFKEVISRSGISKDKIFVLGSARYCKEWMQQNNKILQRSLGSNEKKSQKLKVVFMTTRPNYRIDVDRMIQTFRMLSQIEGVEIVIKPHTRSGEEAAIYKGLPLPELSDLSSVELCEWADVMIVIGSSILIETLVQRKPVLYLKYLHDNITLYEELEACWTITSEADLEKALLSLKSDKKQVPYTEQNIDRFLTEIISGGRSERDVLGDYERFIVDISKGTPCKFEI